MIKKTYRLGTFLSRNNLIKHEEMMRIFFLVLITFALTACSKPYDKYIGYWKLEDSSYSKILEIRKEAKDTYLVNEDILNAANLSGQNKKELVLEQKDKQLGVNNGLTVIPFNLSDDGNSLRIRENKYIKITENEAKTAIKNRQECNQLESTFREQRLAFRVFVNESEKKQRDELLKKYSTLQNQIADCKFHIPKAR